MNTLAHFGLQQPPKLPGTAVILFNIAGVIFLGLTLNYVIPAICIYNNYIIMPDSIKRAEELERNFIASCFFSMICFIWFALSAGANKRAWRMGIWTLLAFSSLFMLIWYMV